MLLIHIVTTAAGREAVKTDRLAGKQGRTGRRHSTRRFCDISGWQHIRLFTSGGGEVLRTTLLMSGGAKGLQTIQLFTQVSMCKQLDEMR